MFEWFWEFLYGISKTLMQVCDLIMSCAKALIGIDEIQINGEKTDFLTYLLRSDYVSFAFGATFSLAVIVLFIFAVIAIIRNGFRDQPNTTPAKIGVNILKNILYFLAVPVCMLALTFFLNKFLIALNAATSRGDTSSIGSYLFTIFARSAGLSKENEAYFLTGAIDYTDIAIVKEKIILADFNYIMCWIVSGIVLYNLATALVSFVERAISIIILYILAPFSIAASELDEGARYKTWRELVISKYLSAYGILIAINIYLMLCSIVTNDNVVFFSNNLLNNVAKLFIILGGALSMKKAHSLIGSLISNSAAQDINDPSNQAGRGLLGKMIRYSPIGLAAKGINDTVGKALGRKFGNMAEKMGNSALNSVGISTSYDTNRLNGTYNDNGTANEGSPTDSQNTNTPQYNNANDTLREALGGDGQSTNSTSNENTSKPQENDNKAMSDALKSPESNVKPKQESLEDEDLR